MTNNVEILKEVMGKHGVEDALDPVIQVHLRDMYVELVSSPEAEKVKGKRGKKPRTQILSELRRAAPEDSTAWHGTISDTIDSCSDSEDEESYESILGLQYALMVALDHVKSYRKAWEDADRVESRPKAVERDSDFFERVKAIKETFDSHCSMAGIHEDIPLKETREGNGNWVPDMPNLPKSGGEPAGKPVAHRKCTYTINGEETEAELPSILLELSTPTNAVSYAELDRNLKNRSLELAKGGWTFELNGHEIEAFRKE